VKKIKLFLFIWLAPIVWASLIFLASSFPLPTERIPPFPFFDKIIHFFAYIPLGFLVAQALFFSNSFKKNFIILTLVFCLLYGLSDEFHQLFVENRQASILDALADFLGSGVGLTVFNFFIAKKE